MCLSFSSPPSPPSLNTGSRTQPGRNRLIYQLKIQTTLNVTSKWTEKSYELGGRSKARLKFAVRVTCSDNHYGDTCSHYCRSRDDDYAGHYLCSETGQFVCLPGWQGSEHYCKTRKYFFCVTSALISPLCCRTRLSALFFFFFLLLLFFFFLPSPSSSPFSTKR